MGSLYIQHWANPYISDTQLNSDHVGSLLSVWDILVQFLYPVWLNIAKTWPKYTNYSKFEYGKL